MVKIERQFDLAGPKIEKSFFFEGVIYLAYRNIFRGVCSLETSLGNIL